MSEAVIHGDAEGPTFPASAETQLRFKPGRKAGEPERADAPVYLLAAPTEKLERAYRAAMRSRGLSYPQEADIESEIRVWLDDLREAHADDPEKGITPKQFDLFMRDLENYHEFKQGRAVELMKKLEGLQEKAAAAKDEKRAVSALAEEAMQTARMSREDQLVNDRYWRLRRMASEDCPSVKAMDAKREAWTRERMKITARVALCGAEGVPYVVTRLGTEASAESMANIDDDTQEQIGEFWWSQKSLTAAQKKTSDTLPPSSTIPTTTPLPGSEPPSGRASRRSRVTKPGTKSLSSTPAT